jgi:ATP-dependent protease Clp ATPase subunit
MNDKERQEMNKAFDDFDKACETAINACQDFIDMNINEKQENNNEQLPEPPKEIRVAPNYDEMWGVSGYYNDNDGNDIRDRD